MIRSSFLIVLLFLSGEIYACKCGGPGPVPESYRISQYVLYGKVISVELVSAAQTIRKDKAASLRELINGDQYRLHLFDSKSIVKAELKVIERFKGNDAGDTVTFFTSQTGAFCGYPFEEGKEYIVYSSGWAMNRMSSILPQYDQDPTIEQENTFWTNSCTRTTAFNTLEAYELRHVKGAVDESMKIVAEITDGIISDTVNHSPNKEFESLVKLSPIDRSTSDIEIRFYKRGAVTDDKDLRIVRLVNSQWESLEFEQKSRSSKIKTYTLTPDMGYHAFINALIEQDIFKLPDESEVNKKIFDSFATKKEALSAITITRDGYTYIVEFKIDNVFRIYQFRNPESLLLNAHGTTEPKHYVAIKNAFEKDLIRSKKSTD